jgi:hypothetical protein
MVFDAVKPEVQMSEFAKSVWEIENLTSYEAFTLPTWLRERFEAYACGALGDRPSDAEYVKHHLSDVVNDSWLGEWGSAVISGDDVFIFECFGPCFDSIDAFEVAAMLSCTAILVGPSRRYHSDGTTVIFTEGSYHIYRNQTLEDNGTSPPADANSSKISVAV